LREKERAEETNGNKMRGEFMYMKGREMIWAEETREGSVEITA